MAIKGSLDEVGLPDVIQLLARGQKSGRLAVARGSNFGSIFFDHGFVNFAQIVNRRDRLGDVLVKRGRITRDQLDGALAEQARHPQKKLGEILVEQGVISRESLELDMTTQIEEAVYYLFTWNSGTFNFESDVKPDDQDFLVVINPEFLLLEGARRVDEWTLIQKKLPSFDIVVSADKSRIQASDVTLSEHQALLVNLIDGNRDITQLIEDSGLSQFEVGKAVFELMSAGFVSHSGRKSQALTSADQGRAGEHRNLGLAFYGTGMYDECLREFRRVAELDPGDSSAIFYQALIAVRRAEWDKAVSLFKKAAELAGGRPEVLNNLACALERNNDLNEAEVVYQEAVTKDRNNVKVVTGWGVVALRKGDYEVAAGRLDRVKETVGDKTLPAIWYWARSLSSAAMEDFQEAEKILREGIEKHPRSAILKNNLAVILELVGDVHGAEAILSEALESEPSLPQLSKNFGDLMYRAGRFDESFDAYIRATKLRPDLGHDVYFKLGNIAYKRNDQEKAQEYWRKTLELDPEHQLAKTNLETIGALS
ncbi:MAG: tetratricopeptide repeat protein [Gemmatimonadetes bacterium]|nr:tetratricopeptide repeat protein [Gemmatimonadota bacterium]